MSAIEKLVEELRAGLEGVTPGPWHTVQMEINRPDIDRPFVVGPSEVVVATDGICEPARMNDRSFVEDAANMRHIANCSPDNIRAILTDYAATQEEIVRLRAALHSLCDADAAYCGNTIHILCNTHGDAIKTMRLAREALAAPYEERHMTREEREAYESTKAREKR